MSDTIGKSTPVQISAKDFLGSFTSLVTTADVNTFNELPGTISGPLVGEGEESQLG
jgi:hypothetical protein